jgi:hypothetical protein
MPSDRQRERPQPKLLCDLGAQDLVIHSYRLASARHFAQPRLPLARRLTSVMEQAQPPRHLRPAKRLSEPARQGCRPAQMIVQAMPRTSRIRAMRY